MFSSLSVVVFLMRISSNYFSPVYMRRTESFASAVAAYTFYYVDFITLFFVQFRFFHF